MKILLKIAVGAVLLIAVALAVLLIPPHLQIREVQPELPTLDEMLLLLDTPSAPNSIHMVTSSTQHSPLGTISHNAILLTWPSGESFLIDAAMDRETTTAFSNQLKIIGAEDASFFGTIAELLGSRLPSVAGVAFTHLHIDHTQGVIGLCQARNEKLALLQTSWQQEIHNLHTQDSATIIANSCLERLSLEGDVILKNDRFPGLFVVGLGGHTPGSTLFAAVIDNHLWVMSGDITNTKSHLLLDEGKGWAYSYMLVPEDPARTAKLRAWLKKLDEHKDVTVVVSHDAAAALADGLPVILANAE